MQQDEVADDRVERRVRKRQLLCVSMPEVRPGMKPPGEATI